MNARHALFLSSVLLLTACPETPSKTDAGMMVTPIVTSVTPSNGPVSGGNTVIINGTNFVNGSSVAFGNIAATTTFESDRKLTALAPAASAGGAVSVTVTNPGGTASTLSNAYTYSTTSTTKVIAESVLKNDANTLSTGEGTTVSVTVTAEVEVAMLTSGTGQGAGVKAQVGYSLTPSAIPLNADFVWSDAAYTVDADPRDTYAGSVALPGLGSEAQLVYFLAARFSVDDGQTWIIADRDGSKNGVSSAQLAKVTMASTSVGWCKLGGVAVEAPPAVTLRGAVMGPTVYGQVYKENVTNQAGAGAGIKGELGYGAAGTDPSTWTWVAATFNVDTSEGANDEFQAVLPNPGAGTYKFAYRFAEGTGPWAYCDADGLGTDGFTQDQAGTLTVQTVGIDSCKVQFPDALTSYQGRPAGNIYGRVFVQGITEATGAGAGIEGQLGVGAANSMPDMTWSWSAATFNIDDPMGGDEYQAPLTGPAAGSYSYAYRFRLDGGAWTVCDRDGSANGVQTTQLGTLTANAFNVTKCQMENTNAAQTVSPSTSSAPYSVQVTVPTLTEATGQGTPLTLEIGSGAVNADPSTWTNWRAGTFANDVADADRYTGTVTAPATSGTQAVAFRAKVGANAYVYCDQNAADGFQVAQAGTLTTSTTFIQSCTLGTVSQFTLPSGSPLVTTARVSIPGVTTVAGAAPNLRVQFGIGPQGDNASNSTLWGWKSATYAQDVAGEDEFGLTSYPAYTGPRAVSARASLDGITWTYCDLDGSANGYQVANQYDVAVTQHAEFDFCNTQFPTSGPAGTTVYGQIYEPGLTPNAAAPIVAQLGVGAETSDPGLGWTWSAATFGTLSGNNNEYQAALSGDAGLHYAFRYTIDAGIYCYGDLDGSNTNGFSGGTNTGVITP